MSLNLNLPALQTGLLAAYGIAVMGVTFLVA